MTGNDIRSLMRIESGHPAARYGRALDRLQGKRRAPGNWVSELKTIPESAPIESLLLKEFLVHICANFDQLSLGVSRLAADLHSLRGEVRQLSDDLSERPVVRQTSLSDLGTTDYSLSTPLPVVIEEYPGQVLARWPEIQATGSGSSEPEAIWRLKEEVLDLMDELSTASPEDLGPEPRQTLRVLRRVVTSK